MMTYVLYNEGWGFCAHAKYPANWTEDFRKAERFTYAQAEEAAKAWAPGMVEVHSVVEAMRMEADLKEEADIKW